jgi:hypothetical protein
MAASIRSREDITGGFITIIPLPCGFNIASPARRRNVDIRALKAYRFRMTTADRRLRAAALTLFFIVGVWLVPAVHESHCAKGRAAHPPAQCPICTIANAPVLASVSQIAPAPPIVWSSPLLALAAPLLSCAPRDAAQARAPPRG